MGGNLPTPETQPPLQGIIKLDALKYLRWPSGFPALRW